MAKDDAVDDQFIGDLAAPCTARKPVMIARDPQEFRRRRLREQPIGDGGCDTIDGVAIVETVAEAPDGPRTRFDRQRGEPVERVMAVIGRQRRGGYSA